MRRTTTFVLLGLLGLIYGAGRVRGSEDQPEADESGADSVKMLFEDFPLLISCNLTNQANMAFELEWFKDGIQLENKGPIQIFQQNSSLLIAKPTKADVGEYKCQSVEISDTILHRTIRVIYLQIRTMDKSKVISEGEELILECPVEGHPPPDIQWFKDGLPILENVNINTTKVVYFPNKKEMPGGQVRVTNVKQEQRGNYSCIIRAENQEYERWTFVRVKGVYAALWPFLGILVEMIVLGIIIFIFEKRRAKAEFDESDTDQGNDQ